MGARTTGLRRFWDEFVGPEATVTNNALAAGLGLAGTVLAPVLARRRGATHAEATIAGGLAADLWGGVYVNNTRACCRWYERPGQSDADHLRFAALHLHPAAVAWLDRGSRRRVPAWVWASAHYGYLLASTLLIRRQRAARRPLGLALTVGGLALDRILGSSTTVPWFAATYYPKLLLGHAAAALWSDEDLTADEPPPG